MTYLNINPNFFATIEPYRMGMGMGMQIISYTVRPLLSGHVGTGAHPDKGFGRIWETQCLIHAAAYPMVYNM